MNIYIKSQFKGNPRGAGVAAATIEYIDKDGGRHIRRQRVGIENDTKNALDLKICISSMRLLLKPCEITLLIACDYLKNAHQQGWVEKWCKDGWKRANGKAPANVEDWKQFYMLTEIHKLRFKPYDSSYETELDNLLKGGDDHGIKG